MRTVRTFSIGEYDNEGQRLIESINKYQKARDMTFSVVIRKALRLFEKEILEKDLRYMETSHDA